MDDPHPLGRYLGCYHRVAVTGPVGATVTEVEFDMIDFFRTKVDAYVADTGRTLRAVDTPHAPKLDTKAFDTAVGTPGELTAKQCASHLMGSLYGARMANPALSVAITRLASHISNWTAECDRRLERLFAYLKSNVSMVLSGSLGEEDAPNVLLRFWPDANLNGDEFHTKSTSGHFLELAGEHSGRGFPLSWGAKKQKGSASSTQDAETTSMAVGAREELIPVQELVELVLGRPVPAVIGEDNTSTITAVRKGYSPHLRHLLRMQRVSLGQLHELITDEPPDGSGPITLEPAPTKATCSRNHCRLRTSSRRSRV